ncbi:nitroreductase family deazaflavin-dependent oxidoreductase [Streptomyces sp. NPDC006012]|uniref:nitroreductase family deazaflavin-dependent oxidoreductase n=1 Tax=Streptomyces sp. NPDC006012 TaxID=3364739 RepID=UPI0036D1E2E1
MPLEGEYEPSPAQWVREQVALYESSGGTQGTTLWDTGLPVVIVTMRGARSGRIRKVPLMRVEHEGRYAAVASKGGFPRHPVWYLNLKANPHVDLQDGPRRQGMTARELTGGERASARPPGCGAGSGLHRGNRPDVQGAAAAVPVGMVICPRRASSAWSRTSWSTPGHPLGDT